MSKFKILGRFVSKADEAAQALRREKGTGEEFLREIQKTPGVKAAEIKDRKLDKVLPSMGKTTKADVKKVLEQNPPPKLQEEVLGGRDDWRIRLDILENRGIQNLNPAERQEYYQLMGKRIAAGLPQDEAPAKFQDYTIPGGENYREILLKLPKTEPKLPPPENFRVFYDPGQGWVVQSSKRVVGPFAGESEATDKMFQLTRQARKETEALRRESRGFESPHWDQPNVLAHARVSDRVGPNGEKILHIEEIQSDWHQKGRKEGYKSGDEAQQIKELKDQSEYLSRVRKDLVRQADESKDLGKMSDYYDLINEINDITPQLMRLQTQMDNLRSMEQRGVPDAPFKKNWHELTMKRILDYATEKGYDKIAITPGAEQAKRYDLSKQVDTISVSPNPDGSRRIRVHIKDSAERPSFNVGEGGIIEPDSASSEAFRGKALSDIVGKEVAEKIMKAPGNELISGQDLQVGGEGMKGFYDQILPTYLNDLGKPYGAQVTQGHLYKPDYDIVKANAAKNFGEGSEAYNQALQNMTVPVHTFDITPQMREEIKAKGLPLYQVGAPIGAGAAAQQALPTEEPEGPPVPVRFTDNPDVMQMELAGGGAVKKLARLLRAPAKTKQEIEAIAERIAPQVTGEYVRESEKSAKTVAGKTQKQFQREKTLPVDIRATSKEKTVEPVDIEKLKGEVMIGIPGDPTVTGKTLHSVGDVRLESPSPQHGGPLYGLYHDQDHFWASGKGAAARVQNLAREASEQYDAPVLGKYIMMGPDSINYAQHFADANLQAINLERMSPKQIEGFNELLRKGNDKTGPRPGFPGIQDKGSAYLHLAFDPELRKYFNELMQKPTVTETFNLPSGQDIRFAITEEPLRDLETGVTGFSMGRMKPEVSPKELKLSEHPTYSHDIPGEFLGGMRYPVPYELSFPDTLKAIRENPAQAPQEFGSLKMVGPRQVIDQQMIDEIKTYEEQMKKLTGKKKGGEVKARKKVTFTDNLDAMRMALDKK